MGKQTKPLAERLRNLDPVAEIHCPNSRFAAAPQIKEIKEVLEQNGVKVTICPTTKTTSSPGGIFIDVRKDSEVQRQEALEKEAIAGKKTATDYSRPQVNYDILVRSHGYNDARSDVLREMSIWLGQVVQPKLSEIQQQSDLPMIQIRVFEKPASMTDGSASTPPKAERKR